jgi:hypothetical protein
MRRLILNPGRLLRMLPWGTAVGGASKDQPGQIDGMNQLFWIK